MYLRDLHITSWEFLALENLILDSLLYALRHPCYKLNMHGGMNNNKTPKQEWIRQGKIGWARRYCVCDKAHAIKNKNTCTNKSRTEQDRTIRIEIGVTRNEITIGAGSGHTSISVTCRLVKEREHAIKMQRAARMVFSAHQRRVRGHKRVRPRCRELWRSPLAIARRNTRTCTTSA
jgi:hypothetical protein